MIALEKFILSPDVVDLLMGYIALVCLFGITALLVMVFGRKS